MLFLMKIVKFSASIMTGLWARIGGLSLGGRRRNREEGPPTFLGAPPDGHMGRASQDLGETLLRAPALAPPWEWTDPGSQRCDACQGPYVSTVSTSAGHQPWISQVRSTEL